MQPTRRSRICSFRRSPCPSSTPCSPPGGRALPAIRESGRRTSPSSRAYTAAGRSTRPSAGDSSVAAVESAPPCRSSTAGRSPILPARCSTRSSASGGASASRRAPAPESSSPRSSLLHESRRSLSPRSIATRARVNARPRWPGRAPRSSSIISASSATRPICSSISPTGSSTPSRRCVRHPKSSGAMRPDPLLRHATLRNQVRRADRPPSARLPPPRRARRPSLNVPGPRLDLEFFNGLGGFADGGREYVIVLGEGQWTPAPWINVVANHSFGFQVSESGAGYTWSINSRENQLTPWSNDPVGDTPGETLYIRDEDSGTLWGPTLLPIREEARPYIVRHGQGYSRFEHTSHGIALDLLQFVPWDDPVKISRLRIENRTGRARRLSITAYAEWVLGVSRSAAAPFIVTALDDDTVALLARNPWNIDFPDRVAFADLGGRQTAWTCDRTEVLGRHGTPDHPAALERGDRLSGRIGAGLDPCAALQATLELPAAGSAEIVFLLGEAATNEEARALILRYRTADLDRTLQEVTTHWDDILGAVQVRTPDRSMDLLLNRWLLYQTLACRIWARSAFYQAGGAYGFRDQLQDVMALTIAGRDVARDHLRRAAARQFVEGDVQHWWHPPSGRGVRARISDDLVWLPYTVVHYVEATGDTTVLDEVIPFLEGPPLAADEPESYFQPSVSDERGTLYEHCARALDRSLKVGVHGLPLIGSGDWNDGMNRVGHEGRGESVWLGGFLHTTLWEFARRAEVRGEHERAARWRQHVHSLQAALEREAWDGDWYRRAYFDDGTPLGSATNAECRIDSIAQSWAVLSGAANPARAARAMAAVEEDLVRRDQGLILLFTPPFDRAPLDPGYIAGYPPGVRENGGPYPHAALWSVMAFAALRDS